MMSKTITALILAAAALALMSCATAPGREPSAPVPAIIPRPASLQAAEGVFVMGDGVRLSAPAGDAAARRAADYFADLMRRTRGLDVVVDDGGPGAIVITRSPTLVTAGAYDLSVTPDGVRAEGADDAGLFYAMVTLWQLATQTDTGPAPIAAVAIHDQPRFGWRGLMLDSARHYQSPEFIKAFIDWMALHKLNVFHWHLTDDQAWRLEIKRYPRLTEVGAWRVPAGAAHHDIDPATGRPRLYGGFYTQDQVREIVAYAAARNITVLPEVDVPGHASAAIAAYPELGVADAPGSAIPEVPADWGVYDALFNTEDSTIVFFENVLDEVMDLFPGTYVHLGGDEARKDQWKASPRTQERMRELGVADEHALQSWFIGRMEAHLNRHGRRLIGWDEILEGGLAPDATVMSWRGVEGAIESARLGHDTVLSPAPTFYLDNRQSASDGAPGRGFVVTLQDLYEFNPTPAALTPQQVRHVLGVQANLWTEHMRTEDRVEHQAYPRVAALAELGWTAPERMDWADFSRRLEPQLGRYRRLGIDYAGTGLDAAPATPGRGERRYDHQMKLCTDGLSLSLIDDAPIKGDRPAFLIDIMNPCWIYQGADLSDGAVFEAAVGQVPFNFQIGADIEKIRLRPPHSPAGELEVRMDGCDGAPVLSLSLADAATRNEVTTLRGALPPTAGVHDLCLIFTQAKPDPMWGVDWVRLAPGGER